jgi:hypothetical protein
MYFTSDLHGVPLVDSQLLTEESCRDIVISDVYRAVVCSKLRYGCSWTGPKSKPGKPACSAVTYDCILQSKTLEHHVVAR